MSSCGKTYRIRREYSTVQQLSGTLSGRIRACLVEYIMTEMSASKYIAQGESLEEKLLQKERWFLFHESVTGQKSQISNPSSVMPAKTSLPQPVVKTADSPTIPRGEIKTADSPTIPRGENDLDCWDPHHFRTWYGMIYLIGMISQNLTFEMSTVRIIS